MKTSPLSSVSKIRRNPSFISADVGKDAVLLDVDSGQLLQLNKTAASIWRLLEKPVSFSELCEKIGQTFEGDDKKIASDITEFVAQMQSQNSVLVD